MASELSFLMPKPKSEPSNSGYPRWADVFVLRQYLAKIHNLGVSHATNKLDRLE